MSTAISTSRGMTTPVAAAELAATPPRVVVLERDIEMVTLLREIVGADYQVVAPAGPPSIVAIDAEDPDIMVIGGLDPGLTADDIIALAARHMRLHDVPIILLSADADVLTDAGRLTQHPSVTVLSLPFDVDSVRGVLLGLSRQAAQRDSMRLPRICAHGFDVAEGRCARCG